LRRYDTHTSDDGLESSEGAFLACTFWLADAYVLVNRVDEARTLFERLLTLRNDVGLLSEEYDPRTGRLAGNFPQAFSHVALINTAHNLEKAAKPSNSARACGRQERAGECRKGHNAMLGPLTLPPERPPRRKRYAGKNPRAFAERYKELAPEKYQADVQKVLASGKTPAGTHRPIMVAEVLECLRPAPGQVAVDCTLGGGGHARAILERLRPGGKLIGLDVDPIELPRTEAALRAAGFGPETFVARRTNFAGLPRHWPRQA
jgi:hypothetical protein